MARALVLHLLLAGVAAMPTRDALDHATSHSRDLRPIDEEVADAHDQHALTPPDGDGVRQHVGAAHGRARRASSRAELGQTPRHPELERKWGTECGHVLITDDERLEEYTHCNEMTYLEVRVRPARARLIAPAQLRASRRPPPAAELARDHSCVRYLMAQL